MQNSANTDLQKIHLLDLPHNLIENILEYLEYKELDTIRCVCTQFHSIGINCMKSGIEKVLTILAKKMTVLEAELQEVHHSLEHKITLNQTFTTLKLLRMHVYSLYVLRRHFLFPKCHFTPFGIILDNIIKHLQQMKITNCLSWLQHCLQLQTIISRFNIYNENITGNLTYPFGVHVIDILDVLTGINYDIKCIYNFDECSCTVFAYYYTENIKFLTYMPDINFIKDCQDRYLTQEERTSILKYLLALVNLYNGLHGKKEEYDREMQFASNESPKFDCRHPMESHFCRNVVKREYLSNTSILELYLSQHTEQKHY
ncbi:uncharacterized protein [Atheta coriaria]|uniref:uncharacterized protein n=1 Tax=Dalotia coriaria TaxID=877792 RepID=UPI0031F4637D